MRKSMKERNHAKLICSVLFTACVILLSSCGQTKEARMLRASKADSLIFDIGTHKDYDRMIAVTDSFEKVGDISPLNADRWRGAAYYHMGQYQKSEEWPMPKQSGTETVLEYCFLCCLV